MTKPRARYQGVTERGTTESVSPPSPRCNRRRSLEERREKHQGETAAARLGSPHRPFFDTEDNCEQKLCQELPRQAVFLNERRQVDRRTRLPFKHRIQAKGPRCEEHDDSRDEQNHADRNHKKDAPRLDKG